MSLKNREVDEEYAYEDGAVQNNGHHPQSRPLPDTWNQDHQYTQGDYTYTSMGSEKSTETNDFSTDEYESKRYPQGTNKDVVYNGEGGRRDIQNYGDHNNGRNQFQVSRVSCLVYFVNADVFVLYYTCD